MSTVLDERKPLRDSILWDLQKSFYDKVSVKAWTDAIVPNFVTSNAFLANCYARNQLAFIRDHFLRNPDAVREQPIYIVEIGSGHGKLAYLTIQKLLKMKEFWPNAKPFKYIITDFTQNNLDFWDKHEPLQRFFELGLLDMAVFNAEKDTELRLQRSGEVLNTSTLKNPMVIVCNYIFDTLRQDAFRIVEGQLQEALCTVASDQHEEDPLHPDVIRRISCHWAYRPCGIEVYDDPHLQHMLKVYLSKHRNASLLVPIGGILAIQNLKAMTGGKLFMICGDKAYNHDEELAGLRDPHVAIHGSFSFMVNFNAVKLFVDHSGGFALHSPFLDGFKCAGFLVGYDRAELPELRYAWHDTMDTFGPDNFSTLQRCIKDETMTPSAKLGLATIRMSQYDSDVFFKFKQVLIDKAPFMTEKQQHDLRRDMLAVYECYYPLQRSKDIAFEIGRLFMGLKRYAEAVKYFVASQTYCGEHHVSWYNMGICHSYTDELDKSLNCFQRSLEIRPDYHDALHWKTRISTRISELSATSGEQEAEPADEVRKPTKPAVGSTSGGGGGGGCDHCDGCGDH